MARRTCRVAIAIPTYNRDKVLIDSIHDALRQEPGADEVIVIDQSDSHSPEVQAELDHLHSAGQIRYLRQFPANLPAARNRALRETTCDVVIFIDDDVRLEAGFVAAHRRNYEEEESLSAVAGRVEQRLGWPQRKNKGSWRPELDYWYLSLDGKERKEGIGNFIGANHSVKVAQVLNLGGYDERFRGAMREESDLALRIYLQGGKIVFDPSASLYHLSAPSGGCRTRNNFDMATANGMLLFAFKHLKALRTSAWREVWTAFRHSVIHRSTIKYPHRIPILCLLFIYALARNLILGLRN
ncbi:MAG TPA: glycosyltransferase [Blastocatellia bacterium]|nr:glycosyltransferase [Blastocatellia bacterium]